MFSLFILAEFLLLMLFKSLRPFEIWEFPPKREPSLPGETTSWLAPKPLPLQCCPTLCPG